MDFYFKSGWLFFIPYLLLYLAGAGFGIPVLYLKHSFWALHGLHFLLLLRLRWNAKVLGIGAGLFMLLWLPGAYLEYPADPWEHLRRIFQWEQFQQITENPQWHKFSYFWGWTLMGCAPVLWKRPLLDLYSAFWQGLLLYQFMLFLKELGFAKTRLWTQLLGVGLFFGTNLFTFRYYALASTPLAYIAYLAALRLVLSAQNKINKKDFVFLPLLLALMLFNHLQELALALMSLLVLGIVRYGKWRKLVPIFGVGLLFGVIWQGFCPPEYYPKDYQGKISFLGTIHLWQRNYAETIGLHGFLGILSAFFLRKKYPVIAALTLAPILVLQFPPFVILFSKQLDFYITYRLFYLLPTSIAFVLGVEHFLRLSIPKTMLLLVLLSLPYGFPWRGRGFFQFYVPPKVRALADVDRVADWFSKKATPDCWIVTDDATSYGMNSLLGREMIRTDRLAAFHYADRYTTTEKILEASKRDPLCGVLVPDLTLMPPAAPSLIASSTLHWAPDQGDAHALLSHALIASAPGLERAGWKKHSVSPYFYYYENPNHLPVVQWTQVGERNHLFLSRKMNLLVTDGSLPVNFAEYLKDHEITITRQLPWNEIRVASDWQNIYERDSFALRARKIAGEIKFEVRELYFKHSQPHQTCTIQANTLKMGICTKE